MKRLASALIALAFAFAAGCAEQPGKKKEEDGNKVETKAVDSGKPADAKGPGEVKAAPAPEEKK